MDVMMTLVERLAAEMAEAYKWGGKHRWPMVEKYPQYDVIREIGTALYSIGGEAAMREAVYSVAEKKSEYASMLGFMF